MPDSFEHALDLTVLAFVNGQLDDARREQADSRGRSEPVVELDALLERCDVLHARRASHFGAVRLLDAVAGMRETIRQLPVVREEQRTCRIRIEATDRDDMRLLRHELDNGRASLRVDDGRADGGRL